MKHLSARQIRRLPGEAWVALFESTISPYRKATSRKLFAKACRHWQGRHQINESAKKRRERRRFLKSISK